MIAHFSYVERDSPIHRLDPGAKVLFLLCYLFSIVLFLDVRVLAILLAVGLGYYRLSRVAARRTQPTPNRAGRNRRISGRGGCNWPMARRLLPER